MFIMVPWTPPETGSRGLVDIVLELDVLELVCR
jgi:hypothetical protein